MYTLKIESWNSKQGLFFEHKGSVIQTQEFFSWTPLHFIIAEGSIIQSKRHVSSIRPFCTEGPGIINWINDLTFEKILYFWFLSTFYPKLNRRPCLWKMVAPLDYFIFFFIILTIIIYYVITFSASYWGKPEFSLWNWVFNIVNSDFHFWKSSVIYMTVVHLNMHVLWIHGCGRCTKDTMNHPHMGSRYKIVMMDFDVPIGCQPV